MRCLMLSSNLRKYKKLVAKTSLCTILNFMMIFVLVIFVYQC